MIKGRRPGDNITLFDTKYCYSRKQEDGTWADDFITILYKDLDTGIKKREVIKKPDYIFYEANEDVAIDHNLFFIEEEKVKEVTVPYSQLLKKIAQDTGNLDPFYENLKNGHKKDNNQLHYIKTIFNSDMNIEDHYRFRFDLLYKNEPEQSSKITKAYLDIETDTKDMQGDFPMLGECPINAISLINDSINQVDIFCLEDDEYTGIEEFKDGLRNGSIFTELKEFLYNHMGFDDKGRSKYEKFGICNYEFKFHFYDSFHEIDLIKDTFLVINTVRPDFLLAWNMPFDIPYIIERVKTLGYNPCEILCSPDIPMEERYAEYWLDVRNSQKPGNRGDTFNIAGYTIYLDQLVEFASRRKGQSAFDNLKLDNIGTMLTGIGKLDTHKFAKSFADFPRKAYKWFIFYNIMDTIVQKCIEDVTEDIDFVYNKALVNNTRYSKAHKQTVYLTNRGIKDFRAEGFIMGNNVNSNNPKPKDKFPGALVGDPLNNNDYSKIILDGRPINMCANLDDYDFKSLYPSVDREFNMAPNTQIGKIIIPNKVHDKENPFNYGRYERGGQFLEDFQCGSYLEFGSRWLHLGNYMEVIEDMKEYFAKNGSIGQMTYPDKPIELVHKLPENVAIELVEPIEMGRKIPLIARTKSIYQDVPTVLDKIKSTAQMDVNDYEKMLRRKAMEEEEDSGFYGEDD